MSNMGTYVIYPQVSISTYIKIIFLQNVTKKDKTVICLSLLDLKKNVFSIITFYKLMYIITLQQFNLDIKRKYNKYTYRYNNILV